MRNSRHVIGGNVGNRREAKIDASHHENGANSARQTLGWREIASNGACGASAA